MCNSPATLSPFAPMDEDSTTEGATGEDGESSLKEVEGMTLIGQVLHPDCRPALEFGIVSPSPFPILIIACLIMIRKQAQSFGLEETLF